jgi:putative ABC transport system ATP-binding protein
MIETRKITKVFRTDELETTAVHAVDLRIKRGDFIAIMGPSGCGKSTLLNILGLIDDPSSGEVIYDGQNLSQLTENQKADFRRDHIGYVFQNFNLIDELTVFENVELPLIYARVPHAERLKKVETVLEELHLMHRRNHFPQQLSGGQQQRAAVARAIVNEPQIILADEPTGNLDSQNGQEIMKSLSTLNEKGHTILMVTHSDRDASYCHEVWQMLDGQFRKNPAYVA